MARTILHVRAVVLAAMVGGAKDYHITRASSPTIAFSYGGQAFEGILSECRGQGLDRVSEISTRYKRG